MDYKSTTNLPQTAFSMKAELPAREPEMLKVWLDTGLYKRLMEKRKGRPLFILHDGPPYSNGDIHMGHALNKILKDFILRYKNMTGFQAPYIPGWDNHGLPIEKAVEKEVRRRDMSKMDFRNACRDFAQTFIDRQRTQFQRLGILGDWENPYLTMTPSFEADELEIFGEMVEKGYIHRGLKPVYWCVQHGTALAESEVDKDKEKEDDSIYVRFPIKDDNGVLAPFGDISKMSVVIWTTTTWTLPGNLAISLHPDFEYALCQNGDEILIIAEDLKEKVEKEANISPMKVLGKVKGRELEYATARHPLYDRESLIIIGTHVTADNGTGCVHTAPGHGMEDYTACLKYDLLMRVPVDEHGCMTEEAGPYAGQTTSEASQSIADDLRTCGALLASGKITHSYPHCTHCKKPILFRATEQWFASVEVIKEAACAEVDIKEIDDGKKKTFKALKVGFIPEWGHKRMVAMIRERADWCISRQRDWGLPIPAFYCQSCDKDILTKEIVVSIANIIRKEGSNAWYAREAKELLPEGFACPHCGSSGEFKKETSTLDVWFDSGTSHHNVLRHRVDHSWPADLYLEGNDQYRGWFQSSLLTAVATRDECAPYKNVIVHGFVVDKNGRKMGKSEGNGIDPLEICGGNAKICTKCNELCNEKEDGSCAICGEEKWDTLKVGGADILRLWVSSADYRNDIRIGNEICKQLSDVYMKIRNTCRFLLGNLNGFNPDSPEWNAITELDRWVLDRLDTLVSRVRESYDKYEFHMIFQAVNNFCVSDMSNFYLDILKDRLYCSREDDPVRRAAQTVLYTVLDTLARLIAPILAYTSEEIWRFMPHHKDAEAESVLFNDMPEPGTIRRSWSDGLQKKWDVLIKLRQDVNSALETARAAKQIGKPLEASVTVTSDGNLYDVLDADTALLPELFIVSAVLLKRGDYKIDVSIASGGKCERCWGYFETLGSNPSHPSLCPRCTAVVG